MNSQSEKKELRRGWTTGACATAAVRAAVEALWTGQFPDPVSITLPRGQVVAFSLAETQLGEDFAQVSVIKDAGDDPDVTHGATVRVTVRRGALNTGIRFFAGEGVGTVTKPGLVLAPGEPAINPVPRQMMTAAIGNAGKAIVSNGGAFCDDLSVEVAIPGGEELAKKTLNGRLGIVGGLSILGTTGIVIPFSCAAWIDSIHRSIDIARATDITHIAGSTGTTSENAIAKLDNLPDAALVEMGDFVGGMLKYVKTHPVARVTIAGGIAKMIKLAQGRLDLHSKRGGVDFEVLAAWLQELGASSELIADAKTANTALEVFQKANAEGLDLGLFIADRARDSALKTVKDKNISIDVAVFDRDGKLVGRTTPS